MLERQLETSADDTDAKQATFIEVKSLKATYHHRPAALVRQGVIVDLAKPVDQD